MVESEYVFLRGNAVDIENAGEHDYEFVSGKSLSDTGLSNTVFVSGTGLGGVGWDLYYYADDEPDTGGFTAQVGSNPLFEVEHNGSADVNTFGILRRREPLDSQSNFTVTFVDVEATTNGADNNRSFGVFDGAEGTRPFDNNDVKAMYFSDQERVSGGSRELNYACNFGDGNSGNTDEGNSPPSYPSTFSIEYDGSDVSFYVNGSFKTSLNAPSATDWYPAISLEDDTTVSDGERLTVSDVEFST